MRNSSVDQKMVAKRQRHHMDNEIKAKDNEDSSRIGIQKINKDKIRLVAIALPTQ